MVSIPCITDLSERETRRARYALETLLLPLGVQPAWTHRVGETTDGLYYGPERRDVPSSWLHLPYAGNALSPETDTRAPTARSLEWDGLVVPMLFPVDPPIGPASGLPAFDLVAGSFFWLSGVQESMARTRDRHGRFPFGASVQAVHGAAGIPVVDVCRRLLARALDEKGVPTRPPRWSGRSWALCPTHDVDYLRKYRPGIWYREVVEYYLLGRNPTYATGRGRRATASLKQAAGPDPFRRSIRTMIRAVSERAGTATWFFKSGSFEPYDVPYGLGGRFARRMFESLRTSGFDIGLHPSYFASVNPERTRREKLRLEGAAGTAVTSVRQHYLRYDVRTTPLVQEQAGFRVDSTLGFAEHEGFRRGTCLPFRVYDLVEDRPTSVWQIPLLIMDSTLFGYRGLTAEEAFQATTATMARCRDLGGLCTCLWHSVLEDQLDFPGWGEHFTRTLDAAEREGGAILSLASALDQWERFLATA